MSVRNPQTLMAVPHEDKFDFLFKIILIGDTATGKSCILERFKSGNFVDRYTIGVDFSIKTVIIDGKLVKLQIWDTAGQERFRTLNRSYYRLADGVILVYDITNRDTFGNLHHWIEEIRHYITSNVMVIVVGNKTDLEDERQVEFEEAQQMCQFIPEVLFFIETSAKENHCIDETFLTLAHELKRRVDTTWPQNHDPNAIQLGRSRPLHECNTSACNSCHTA